MALRASDLTRRMVEAAAESLQDRWPDVRDYARGEFQKIAHDILLIERLRKQKKISARRARLHLEVQKNAAKTVLLATEGMGILAAEAAINAALRAINDTVNAAIGFRLL